MREIYFDLELSPPTQIELRRAERRGVFVDWLRFFSIFSAFILFYPSLFFVAALFDAQLIPVYPYDGDDIALMIVYLLVTAALLLLTFFAALDIKAKKRSCDYLTWRERPESEFGLLEMLKPVESYDFDDLKQFRRKLDKNWRPDLQVSLWASKDEKIRTYVDAVSAQGRELTFGELTAMEDRVLLRMIQKQEAAAERRALKSKKPKLKVSRVQAQKQHGI